MLRVLLAISTIIATGLALILAVVLQDPQVSTIEIDRDRTALAAEISTTQAESEKYPPSLLKSLIEVRLAITQNTLAMLDQKRASVIFPAAAKALLPEDWAEVDARLCSDPSLDRANDEKFNSLRERILRWEQESTSGMPSH